MKKTTKIFIAISLVLAAFVTTGCDLYNRAKEAVENTYNTWYVYSGDQSISIPLGSNADDEDGTSAKSLDNVEFYVYYDGDDGLKVAVQAKSKQNVELLGGLITKETQIYTGGTKQYTKEQFGPVQWTGMISALPFEETNEPQVSKNPDECIILAGDEAGDLKIQWQKVLKRVLINKLLGEV